MLQLLCIMYLAVDPWIMLTFVVLCLLLLLLPSPSFLPLLPIAVNNGPTQLFHAAAAALSPSPSRGAASYQWWITVVCTIICIVSYIVW
jgi:hypothetical protein